MINCFIINTVEANCIFFLKKVTQFSNSCMNDVFLEMFYLREVNKLNTEVTLALPHI